MCPLTAGGICPHPPHPAVGPSDYSVDDLNTHQGLCGQRRKCSHQPHRPLTGAHQPPSPNRPRPGRGAQSQAGTRVKGLSPSLPPQVTWLECQVQRDLCLHRAHTWTGHRYTQHRQHGLARHTADTGTRMYTQFTCDGHSWDPEHSTRMVTAGTRHTSRVRHVTAREASADGWLAHLGTWAEDQARSQGDDQALSH